MSVSLVSSTRRRLFGLEETIIIERFGDRKSADECTPPVKRLSVILLALHDFKLIP